MLLTMRIHVLAKIKSHSGQLILISIHTHQFVMGRFYPPERVKNNYG